MQRKRWTKRIAVLLAVLFLSQSATAAFGVSGAAEKQKYTGTVLAAINTDYSESEDGKTFDVQTAAGTWEAQPRTKQIQAQQSRQPWELLWEQVEPMTPEEAALAQEKLDGSVAAQGIAKQARVGDTRTIPGFPEIPDNLEHMPVKDQLKWLADYALNNKLRLHCVYTNDVCTIWIEDPDAWTPEAIRELGDAVGTLIPQMEDMFGTPKIDTDRDGKFALFIHRIPQSDATKAKQGGIVAGYHSVLDLLDSFGRIGKVWMKSMALESTFGGAKADCLHINMEITQMDVIKPIFAHEYQHYIHESYLYAGKTNRTCLHEDTLFINEGFSMASEMILAPDEEENARLFRQFNNHQQDYSLVTWENHITNYALVLPFFQYIRTRYAALIGDTDGAFPGTGIYRWVLESRNQENQDDTLGIIADILYPADLYPALTDTDARCRQLIADFWLAVYYKAPHGEHGFNAESWADAICVQTRWIEETPSVRNGMAAFFLLDDGNAASAVVRNADEGIRFIAIEEPVNTVTFDRNGGFGEADTYCTFASRFTIPEYDDILLYREGYTFTGWSRAADAQQPTYAPGEEIALQGRITLYAVWAPTTVIEVDTVYTFTPQEASDVRVQFTPPEDGVYYLESDTAHNCRAYHPQENDGEAYVWHADEGIYLHANVTYLLRLCFDAQEGAGGSYALRLRPTCYSLRYYTASDPYAEEDCWMKQQYGVTYTVVEYTPYRDGYDCVGWSTQPDDIEAAYLPCDTITLTQDACLYAVWAPWDPLTADEPYTVESPNVHLCFVPEETAVYKVIIQSDADERSFTLRDRWGNIDEHYAQTESLGFNMYEGETYYIEAENVSSILVKKVSTSLTHDLWLVAPNTFNGECMATLSVELHGQRTYTLPEYRPISFGFTEFSHWVDLFSGEKYYPGDILVLDRDVILVAISTSVYGEGRKVENLSDSMVYLTEMIAHYIPVWCRCFFQRVRLFGLKGLSSQIKAML